MDLPLASTGANVAIGAVFVLVALGYILWALSQARTRSCPYCALHGDDEPLFPAVGNLLWICFSCWRLQPSAAAQKASQILLSEQEARERLRQRLPGRRRRDDAAGDDGSGTASGTDSGADETAHERPRFR